MDTQFFSAFPIVNFRKESAASPMIYARRNYYKIVLTTGHATYFYGDRQELIEPGQSALVFTNREVPYRWEVHSGACEGFSCIFTDDFLPLHTYQRPADWSVFDPAGQSFFRLTPEETNTFKLIFEKILQEQQSTYTNKSELLFLYVLECIHCAMKLLSTTKTTGNSAAARITNQFHAVLAQQFCIGPQHNRPKFRTAQHFADKLGIHVNYLNRTLKTVTGKTTTQLIVERTIQEARALLLHTDYPVAHISYGLGFEEPTHFTQFFHKHTKLTPSGLRRFDL